MQPTITGFLNVNKPAGITSHDVVARIRRLVGRSVKVGHAGTLDPAATGVLPVALGHATRLIQYLSDTTKGYRAVVCLGVVTTTDDADGELVHQHPIPPLDTNAIEMVLEKFRGAILQVPPMYSALHHQGKRLYELARTGHTIEREPRPVTIEQLTLRDIQHNCTIALRSTPVVALTLDVTCHKGTYIRALARDIGEAIGCGAHLTTLQRTFVGNFTLEQSIPLVDLLNEATLLTHVLLSPDIAVATWHKVVVNDTHMQHIQHGDDVMLNANDADDGVMQMRAHTADGTLVALLSRRDDTNVWHPIKVFIGV